MKKYYILRADGSSLFTQGYDRDFIFHCLIKLLDRSDERYSLIEIEENSLVRQRFGLSGRRAYYLLRSEEQNLYT